LGIVEFRGDVIVTLDPVGEVEGGCGVPAQVLVPGDT
jgi:hypothetical protein